MDKSWWSQVEIVPCIGYQFSNGRELLASDEKGLREMWTSLIGADRVAQKTHENLIKMCVDNNFSLRADPEVILGRILALYLRHSSNEGVITPHWPLLRVAEDDPVLNGCLITFAIEEATAEMLGDDPDSDECWLGSMDGEEGELCSMYCGVCDELVVARSVELTICPKCGQEYRIDLWYNDDIDPDTNEPVGHLFGMIDAHTDREEPNG
jgi:hypothetical protein